MLPHFFLLFLRDHGFPIIHQLPGLRACLSASLQSSVLRLPPYSRYGWGPGVLSVAERKLCNRCRVPNSTHLYPPKPHIRTNSERSFGQLCILTRSTESSRFLLSYGTAPSRHPFDLRHPFRDADSNCPSRKEVNWTAYLKG